MAVRKAALLCLIISADGYGLSLYEHSDTAGKHALLFNIGIFNYEIGGEFSIPYIQMKADYVLPVFPVSLGAYMRVPDGDNPNLKNFGLRAGYHPDIGVKRLDLYVFYNFDFGFLRNGALREYGDDEQPVRWYDIRAGVRFIYGAFAGLYFETGYKVLSFDAGIVIKIN